MKIFKAIEKTAIACAATTVLALSLNSPLYAQDEGSSGLSAKLLADIRQYTHDILDRVNKLPDYIQAMTALATSWLDSTDESKSIEINGSLFSMLASARNANIEDQINQTKASTRLFLGKNNKIETINDFSYTTLLGAPLVSPNKTTGDLTQSINNYIKNASGSNLPMVAPDPEWKNQSQERQDYYTLYSTLASVQSYNSYIFNKAYADRQGRTRYPEGIPSRKKGDAASVQDILAASVENASSTKWYATVASESIGLVLRQLLVFTSQNYILLEKILETQQDALMAQAMTNTLLMQNAGIGQGRLLYKQATGAIGGQ